jgi:hypothetical protein
MSRETQLQRVPLDRNFFWHGVLQLNENGGQTFFDVRSKKQVPGAPQRLGLYTADIPPFPLASTDTLTCSFILENNQGLTCQRNKVCEASLPGSELEKAIANPPPKSTPDSILVTTETGEWQFQLIQKCWVLRSVLVYVAQSVLKEFVKDI